MVKDPELESVTHQTMLRAQYVPKRESSFKQSAVYRYFMGRDADYTIKQNPYQVAHPDDVWDSRKGHYSSYSNNFPQHHQ